MTLKTTLAASAIFLTATGSMAGTVAPDSNVVFEFDLSAIGDITFDWSRYDCGSDPECMNGTLRLADGATMRVLYGTTAGGDDVAVREFVNPFGIDIFNAFGVFVTAPSFSVAASVDTLFATFEYVDDIYGIDTFQLNNITGVEIAAPAPVPLPASVLLLGAAVAGFGVMRRRTA